MSVLPDLAAALASGTVEVIDLTAPLSSSTPTLKLPPQFGQTATFELEQISNYDDRVRRGTGTTFVPASTPAHISTPRATGLPARAARTSHPLCRGGSSGRRRCWTSRRRQQRTLTSCSR